MPFGRSSQAKPAPTDAGEWRPQTPGFGNPRNVHDPVIEPFWEGLHVLVHAGGGAVQLLDEHGSEWRDDLPEIATAIREAIQAEHAIVDGFVTPQAADAEPVADVPAPIGANDLVKQMIVGDRKSKRVPMPPTITPGAPLRFVAVDLLEIDGNPLLDVPLLERKRLLEGSVVANGPVSLTSFARPPADGFIDSCRAIGFWAVVYKDANSRYLPGQPNHDWAVFRIPSR